MSLATRIEAFDQLDEGIAPHTRPSPLILTLFPDSLRMESLRDAACRYINQCLPGPGPYLALGDRYLVDLLTQSRGIIPNMTPNGMLVPKRHTMLSYNTLVKAFADVMTHIGLAPFVVSWHIPLNVRVKYGEADTENLKRHHPTEHIHSDSWAGESSESLTVHIPLFGDLPRNHVTFYAPPDDFQEDWLGPRPNYQDGSGIAESYTAVRMIPRIGQVVLADFASLHASTRLPGADLRVSIDTTCVIEKPTHHEVGEKLHPWKLNERASHTVLSGIGETHLFVFPDTNDQQVDSEGGFKHPSNLTILELFS